MVGAGRGCEPVGRWTSTASESNSSRSPLATFGFFKNLTGEKKTTRDGQPAKRRGPKPDSKPALTRRQELNRQAQRTHRERKEMYIKQLEQEVVRLRDAMASNNRERDAAIEENRRLRALLAQHGVHVDMTTTPPAFNNTTSYTPSTSGSASTGYAPNSSSTGFTSPPRHPDTHPAHNLPIPPRHHPNHGQMSEHGGAALNYDEIGMDFVLTLERPCMDHMQMLHVHSATGADEDISGHALMASCPPAAHIRDKPTEPYPLQLPEGIVLSDLLKGLLDLSHQFHLEGELTPMMAWVMILKHDRLRDLNKADFVQVKEELLAKVHCYGFGAVLEEFEVLDALSNVLIGKPGGCDVDSA
ncbi:hypothetical protein EJ05DRAFT_494977 [Pseudovirgaria hyperparasitica]|uniref:BZIP domain-containing protein n=1 Tax=Pseudovirgaria hyperparasitica TaxID=470096 RepID=A0A6A6VTK6_9PEZI|nr:uncharacterized protein EJ05DRAFT_494977 [Pseudovirgaria hyperparasitica]KAF2753219.1 hypothetical protein EJ05DRAFT_494977 [Pseudovirgaria hyperparasitica]